MNSVKKFLIEKEIKIKLDKHTIDFFIILYDDILKTNDKEVKEYKHIILQQLIDQYEKQEKNTILSKHNEMNCSL